MSVRQLSSQDFDSVLSEGKPVLVDFFAVWCGPCKLLSPVMEQLSEELSSRAAVCKLDIDQETAIARRFGVQSVPTVILFQDGREKARLTGYHPAEAYLELLG